MKSLRQIYVEYEIGEIYPERLPNVLKENLDFDKLNNAQKTILNMDRPSRTDINEYLLSVFEITDEQRLSKIEKLDLLINKWLVHKLDSNTLFSRIKYFELEDSFHSNNFEQFIKNLSIESSGHWIPSDDWDWTIDNLKKEFIIENRYSEFLIKTSC
ncbi:hypothetical protein [Aquimarina latercula]|uniref:hypothetical protein n=1 Tax=Aquimarina latercula TaxID=987 RepID=UPI000480FA74|nr:hypothetical protein [Aquimarina latercula]